LFRYLPLAVLALSAPALAGPRDMFDLVCTGRQQLATGAKPIAWNERFRFDLDGKRWCRGKCATAMPIGYVTEDEITLSDTRAGLKGPPDTEINLSRTSGKISEYVRMGWSGSTAEIAGGTCKREAYSGLPGKKF